MTAPRLYRLELVSALALVLFGLWMFNPWVDTFERYTNYAYLGAVAPEWAWGFGFMFFGLLDLFGLGRGSVRLRRWGMLGVFTCRLFLLAAVAYQTGGVAQGVPEFAMWTLAAAWAFLLIRR